MRDNDSMAVFGSWTILVLGVFGTVARVYLVTDQVGWHRETLYLLFAQTSFDLAIVIGLFVIVRLLLQRQRGDDPELLDDEDASD